MLRYNPPQLGRLGMTVCAVRMLSYNWGANIDRTCLGFDPDEARAEKPDATTQPFLD